MAISASTSRAAQYSQQRRDNEREAVEELQGRLTSRGCHVDVSVLGVNNTTKVMIAAFNYFTINNNAIDLVQITALNTHAEQNKIKRTNEAAIGDKLKGLLPQRILEEEFMQYRHYNPTTKVLVATAKYLDDQSGRFALGASLSCEQRVTSPYIQPNTPDDTSAPQHRLANPFMDEEIPDSDANTPLPSPSPLLKQYIPEQRLAATTTPQDVRHHLDPNRNLSLPPLPRHQPTMTAKRQKRSHSPDKNNHATQPWERPSTPAIPWASQDIERHPLPEIEQLEQVAKRLVAKAKEMVEPPGGTESKKVGYAVRSEGVTGEQRRDLEVVADLMIDALAVIEERGQTKRFLRRWGGERAKWAGDGMV